jgi:aspartate/methionine/tyrosine aminotransferase
MTGLRLGYVAAPQPIAKAITTIQSQLTSCAGSLSQAAGVAALTKVRDDELDENVNIMKEKRDSVKWMCIPPDGRGIGHRYGILLTLQPHPVCILYTSATGH